MLVQLNNISKRYRFEWVFKKIDYTFETHQRYAITGPNGSGKSTLMRVLSGYLSPTKGKVRFKMDNKVLDIDKVYLHINYAAPYIDLIEELTLEEHLLFHQRFKPFLPNLNIKSIIELLAFTKAKNKPIQFFSSGMKQRLKLALAICSQSNILLLDEPTTNLDQQGMEWYQSLVEAYGNDRTIIVASNIETDYAFCNEKINILDYK